MLKEIFFKSALIQSIYYKRGMERANSIVKKIQSYLLGAKKILDIGCGQCFIDKILIEKKFEMTLIDVKDLSMVKDIKVQKYNGVGIPFANKKFDVSLLITVLHHTFEPEKVIGEARRVSDRIIIVEDVYCNVWHKYLTWIADSILNLEFFGHPHNNKNDKEWKKIFNNLGLELKQADYFKSHFFIQHAVYYLM